MSTRATCPMLAPALLALAVACGPGERPADSGNDDATAGDAPRPADAFDPDAAPPPPGDPATRDPALVCSVWNSQVARSQGHELWTAGADPCAPGTLGTESIDDAIRMTNAYRWLAGVPAVPRNESHNAAAQACSVLLEQNRMLSHTPPMTWRCWSELGYEGTSHSNISGGSLTVTPKRAIDGWIDDSRDISMTLGHRRWMLWPQLGPIGYGQARSYACLYVVGTRGSGSKPWVAWPNEGATPMGAMTRIWSFSARGRGLSASTMVTVTQDGAPVAVTAMLRRSGYGDDTVSWDMPQIVAGATYHVRVAGLTGGDVEYDVRPVDCAAMQ